MSVTYFDLLNQDQRYIWHPASQMKDYENFKPLFVKRARGSYLELESGQQVIDAISSWWCKSLGHNHPRLKQALLKQAEQFEHVILANTTNETIVNLSARLAGLTASLNKAFYAGDGSCCIEIALKMSLHSRIIQGQPHKTKLIALTNAYHGETAGALSVSDIGIYKKPYRAMLFDAQFISSIPYVSSIDDPLWSDCSKQWQEIEIQLTPWAESAAAVIVEPIVQGAGGMKIYSQDFLKRLSLWAKKHHVHLIADEIMTGLGRTGKMLACEHAGIEPDFLCLSKGLTSGWLPFSVVLTTDDIYNIFYDDYAAGKAFLHSHTYSGNALGAAIALEVLNIFAEEQLIARTEVLGKLMLNAMREIANDTQKLHNVRGIGAMVAADLICNDPSQRIAFEVCKKATLAGALLRPLGNTLYWLPPLNMDFTVVEQLKNITRDAILALIPRT